MFFNSVDGEVTSFGFQLGFIKSVWMVGVYSSAASKDSHMEPIGGGGHSGSGQATCSLYVEHVASELCVLVRC